MKCVACVLSMLVGCFNIILFFVWLLDWLRDFLFVSVWLCVCSIVWLRCLGCVFVCLSPRWVCSHCVRLFIIAICVVVID